MDTPSFNSAPGPTSLQERLPFVLVIFLEAGFVALLLVVIFGVLGYFHILRLPSFSKPIQPVINNQPKTTYDSHAATNLLISYANITLQSNLLLSNGGISLPTQQDNHFYSVWTRNSGSTFIRIHLYMKPFTNTPDYYQTTIQDGTLSGLPITPIPTTAQVSTQTLFKNISNNAAWNCRTIDKNITNLCITTETSSIGTYRYGVYVQHIPQDNHLNVIFSSMCFIPTSSTYLENNKDCLPTLLGK